MKLVKVAYVIVVIILFMLWSSSDSSYKEILRKYNDLEETYDIFQKLSASEADKYRKEILDKETRIIELETFIKEHYKG